MAPGDRDFIGKKQVFFRNTSGNFNILILLKEKYCAYVGVTPECYVNFFHWCKVIAPDIHLNYSQNRKRQRAITLQPMKEIYIQFSM